MENLPIDILRIFGSLLDYKSNCKFALCLPGFYTAIRDIIEKNRPLSIKKDDFLGIAIIKKLYNNNLDILKIKYNITTERIKIYDLSFKYNSYNINLFTNKFGFLLIKIKNRRKSRYCIKISSNGYDLNYPLTIIPLPNFINIINSYELFPCLKNKHTLFIEKKQYDIGIRLCEDINLPYAN